MSRRVPIIKSHSNDNTVHTKGITIKNRTEEYIQAANDPSETIKALKTNARNLNKLQSFEKHRMDVSTTFQLQEKTNS